MRMLLLQADQPPGVKDQRGYQAASGVRGKILGS
jgi:hypothetical protein